ncbi:hypothetical protein RUM43_007791 [Polyplax serrata]|uniref:Uncharacterized protein n=1 Tax=Polyplax serrata TaxID=468196 RepID=A0AAN8PMR6_POLSC
MSKYLFSWGQFNVALAPFFSLRDVPFLFWFCLVFFYKPRIQGKTYCTLGYEELIHAVLESLPFWHSLRLEIQASQTENLQYSPCQSGKERPLFEGSTLHSLYHQFHFSSSWHWSRVMAEQKRCVPPEDHFGMTGDHCLMKRL